MPMFSNPNGAEVNPLLATTDQIIPPVPSLLGRLTGPQIMDDYQ
jgi:hypothetical protein